MLIYFFSFQLDICIPVRMDHKCKNTPDRFCYICGNVAFPKHQANTTDFVKKAYRYYFGVKLADWRNGKRKCMSFALSMVWDCYFGIITLKEINCKNQYHVQYSDVPSAMRPIHYSLHLLVPGPDGNMEYSSVSKHCDVNVFSVVDAKKPEEGNQPVLWKQAVLNDLTQDPHLSKESAQLLGSCRKKKKNI